MPIGFGLDDLNPVKWVSSAAEAAGDFASSLWNIADDIPGVADFGDGFRNLVTGPLRDLAKTAEGQIVLRALAGSMYAVSAGALGPMLGPQLASATFALPGLVRGEGFWSSWLQESWYRAKTAVAIAGPGVVDQLSDQVIAPLADELKDFGASTSNELAGALGMPNPINVMALAKKFGVTDLVAARTLNYLFPEEPYNPDEYDSVTQKRKGPTFAQKAAAPKGIQAALQKMAAEALVHRTAVVPKGIQAAIEKLGAEAEQIELRRVASANMMAAAERSEKLAAAGNVALIGVGTAAAMAAAWWYLEQRKRR